MLFYLLLFFTFGPIFFLFLKFGHLLFKTKGEIGELIVSSVLNRLGDEYTTLNNLLLQNSNGSTSQIDHVVLSEYGIFVIETKNYKGWIFGNEKSEYWTQVIFDEKYKFRNPIKQNSGHIFALKNLLSSFQNIKYFSIIVFSGKCYIKIYRSVCPCYIWKPFKINNKKSFC